MIVRPATPCLAFDINQQLSGVQAAELKAAGYDVCIRYLPRTSSLVNGNLSALEIQAILGANLGVGAVQHVALPGWQPNAALGTQYGQYAGQYAAGIGLPTGMNIWLDLEEVSSSATAQSVIDYCQAWYVSVLSHGYIPGLYVGWNIVLSPEQLYSNLSYKNYWKAYNADIPVSVRGYCIIQKPQKTLNGITFDPNTIQADSLGGLPIFLYPSS